MDDLSTSLSYVKTTEKTLSLFVYIFVTANESFLLLQLKIHFVTHVYLKYEFYFS